MILTKLNIKDWLLGCEISMEMQMKQDFIYGAVFHVHYKNDGFSIYHILTCYLGKFLFEKATKLAFAPKSEQGAKEELGKNVSIA